MIDICFNDSVGGLLIKAKKLIKSDAILTLDLHLNHGYLDCDIIEEQATRNVETLKYFYKTITEKELQKEYNTKLNKARKAQETLQMFLDNGQKVRLWLSNNANDRCGLYWFCNLAKDYKNKISIVCCPGYSYDDINCKIIEARNWALFSNSYFLARFVDDARPIIRAELLAYAETWGYIVKENAPLRILINDSIVGVKKSFYDDIILSYVNSEPKTQANIIGEMLGIWRGGCDAAFVSERIEHLIDIGKIKVYEDKADAHGCYWSRTLSLIE